MKHFLVQRVCPLLVALSLVISMVIPAYAAFDEGLRDYDSVADWDKLITNPGEAMLSLMGEFFGVEASAKPVFWAAVDNRVIPVAGSVDRVQLNNILESIEEIFNRPYGYNFFEQIFRGTQQFAADIFSLSFLGTAELDFSIEQHPSSGYYRIYENTKNVWLVSSNGTYPYYDPSVEDHWIETSSAYALMGKAKLALVDSPILQSTADQLAASGDRAYVADFGTKYKAIYQDGHKILANSNGYPYVALSSDPEWAVNQDRNDTTVKENGEVIEGVTDNSTNIDLSDMTITLPDGSINFIDQLIYDESTKSYHIDSHDTYNYETNYYYEWNYYINYTSITYIGQTEEYNKYYEVYYELPDGRDSADLTAEELEQLNVSLDIIPYGRSADDTSLRSLYHFDGDTKDASYWNYCTDFSWNKGASLTYMDAGVFDGALYLDEKEHDFTLTLPSNVTAGNFTLQFRYYQSHTLTPQTDSYISFSGTPLFYFNGGQFLDKNRSTLGDTPIGSWNEIALIRENGTLYYYLNGVSLGSSDVSSSFGEEITFHFGNEQQTYKYFDELRFLNYALQTDGKNYTPTAVPHDTNLALVLPDSVIPVADEYWKITSSSENLFGYTTEDFNCGVIPYWYTRDGSSGYHGSGFPAFRSYDNFVAVSGNPVGSIEAYDGYLHLINDGGTTGADVYSGCLAPFHTRLNSYSENHFAGTGDFIFSVVLADGTVYSLPFTHKTNEDKYAEFDWGSLTYEYLDNDGDDLYYLCVIPDSEIDVIYMELVPGSSTDLKAEKIESVTAFDKDSLNTPTLAVRTDLDITSYQIGGVRPSIPEKGQVWALVESGYITSVQIYTGSAWEACDGRIWTGERWVPARSYNIITLQDMYDIKDATQDFEYIYTESGFWTWWQKSWNAFQEKLFGGTGSYVPGGSSAPGSAQENVSNVLSSLIEGILGVITETLKSLIGSASDLISGFFSFFSDTIFSGIKDFFSSFGELVNPFQSAVENEDGTTTTVTALPGGIATVFAFVSGVFMVMPAELRTIMMFGIGLMFLLAVFKKVGA